MSYSKAIYKDWEFEVDVPMTLQGYSNFPFGGADTCTCSDCKNYSANRETVFPGEIIQLFKELGVNYRKEVEIWKIRKLENGLHQIAGWFHFIGKIVSGTNFRIPFTGGIGNEMVLEKITENFEIGFAPGNDLTFFNKKEDLVQIEFIANIPWIISKKIETE